jgi:molybdate transport system permease protein
MDLEFPSEKARPRATRGEGVGPWLLGLLGAVAAAFFIAPIAGLVVRSPLADVPELMADPDVWSALRLSLIVSLGALATSLVLGAPLAYALAYSSFPGRRLVRSVVLVPMVLPPVVGGVALFAAFGRRGLLGPALGAMGVALPFTTAGAVVAAAFVAMPFLVLALEAAFRSVDHRLEDAAATLGATRLTILTTITFPAIRPALGAGAALCWARALGEFGATITFAGNLEGTTQTMPLAVYTKLPVDPGAATALSLVLLTVALAIVVGLRGNIRAPGG